MKMRVIHPFNDMRMVESLEDIAGSKNWVCGLVVPDDVIDVIIVVNGCNDPGCCPQSILFTIPDIPEAKMIEGEMHRAWEGLERIEEKLEASCICAYPNGSASKDERDAVAGHYNIYGGYCCSHWGNTCEHCHHHELRQ